MSNETINKDHQQVWLCVKGAWLTQDALI